MDWNDPIQQRKHIMRHHPRCAAPRIESGQNQCFAWEDQFRFLAVGATVMLGLPGSFLFLGVCGQIGCPFWMVPHFGNEIAGGWKIREETRGVSAARAPTPIAAPKSAGYAILNTVAAIINVFPPCESTNEAKIWCSASGRICIYSCSICSDSLLRKVYE